MLRERILERVVLEGAFSGSKQVVESVHPEAHTSSDAQPRVAERRTVFPLACANQRVLWQAVMVSKSGVSPTLHPPRPWLQWPRSRSTLSPTTASMLALRTNSSSTSSRERKRPGPSRCPPTITESRPDYAKLANPSRYSVNE